MKIRKKLILVLFLSLFLIACSPSIIDPIDEDDPIDEENPDEKEPETIYYDPVEAIKANTDFKPAFEGQTRISGIRTTTAYTTSVVTNTLSEPWGIDVLPNEIGRASCRVRV